MAKTIAGSQADPAPPTTLSSRRSSSVGSSDTDALIETGRLRRRVAHYGEELAQLTGWRVARHVCRAEFEQLYRVAFPDGDVEEAWDVYRVMCSIEVAL